MMTVLMTTRNRSGILREVLQRYLTLQPPAGGWKVVIVDNNSTDDTPSVIKSFGDLLPLTYVFEATPGKNHAVNAGLKSAEGDLVLFTDDDALPEADWLLHYERAARELPEFAMFGGPVTPKWPFPPHPSMLADPDILGASYAITHPGHQEGPAEHPLTGNNFAIRRTFLLANQFDTGIGPSPDGNYIMGSETELQDRLTTQGLRKWWLQAAGVEHIIRPDQMSFDWIFPRARRYGRGLYRRSFSKGDRPALLFGVPRWALRQALRHISKAMFAVVRRDRRHTFESWWYLNMYVGYLEQAWSER